MLTCEFSEYLYSIKDKTHTHTHTHTHIYIIIYIYIYIYICGLLCSTRTHWFDQKYSKNSYIVVILLYITCNFLICFLFLWFISVVSKWIFSSHCCSLQSHMILIFRTGFQKHFLLLSMKKKLCCLIYIFFIKIVILFFRVLCWIESYK